MGGVKICDRQLQDAGANWLVFLGEEDIELESPTCLSIHYVESLCFSKKRCIQRKLPCHFSIQQYNGVIAIH